MKKIAIVVTSRASYARIKSVLAAIRENKDLELFLIGAASLILDKYGNAAEIVERDGFTIHQKVYLIIEGENPTTMAKSVGVGVMELATLFDNVKPNIVISIADRFETICTAIAAAYLNIPVAHIQGGELSGSIDEKVRHAVTKFSSAHFVANQTAKRRLQMMGEAENSIFITGCPSIDLAKDIQKKHAYMTTDYLFSKYGGLGDQVNIADNFVVVLQHPVTTEVADGYEQMNQTLYAVQQTGIPAIILWPNVDAGSDAVSKAIRSFRERVKPRNMHFFRNLTPEDFLALLMQSSCLLGNSSVGIRECSFLGVPVINIGSRQRDRERGPNVIDVEHNKDEIIEALKKQLLCRKPYSPAFIYGEGCAGKKIAQILATQDFAIEKRFVDHICGE